MTNRTKKTPKSKPSASEKIEKGLRMDTGMCKALAKSMMELSSKLGMQISGQTAIEGDGVKFITLFSAFPNGDLLIWFLDKGYYRLISLVNKRFQPVATFSADRMEEFQAALTALQLKLGK